MTQATARLRAMLPKGTHLAEAAFRARHGLIVGVVALHLPALLALGVVGGVPSAALAAGLLPLAAFAGLALAPIGRLGRMLAATAGLSLTSALLVHLTDGLTESYFHFFLTLGLVALYQDWRPYLAALGGVVAHHAIAGLLVPQMAYAHPASAGDPWRWALIHGGFVLAVGMTHLAFWRLTEREQARAHQLWEQLYEGERTVAEQLRSAEAVKAELLSIVSHEFRTPLTSIIGFSHTLMARADQLDPVTIRLCVRNIDQQSRRLARLVHNVLAASGDVATDPSASTDLAVTARDVAREIRDAYDDAAVIDLDLPPALRAAIDREAAHRILLNLLDNAVKFSVPGSEIELRMTAEGEQAVVEVANEASPIATAHLDRIFQPFVQADSSDSRAVDGIGLGLHVVRRLLEACDGSVEVRHRGGRVVFRATVPLAVRREHSLGLTLDLTALERETPRT